MRRHARCAVAALVLFGASVLAHAQELSDLWFNPAESGWGMQLVQQGDTSFVALFVYGPDGQPTWLVAPDVGTVLIASSTGLPTMTGTLYRTSGPSNMHDFDPAKVMATPVGLIDIQPITPDSLLVSYTADGVAVSKTVTRQTFGAPKLDGFYLAAFDLLEGPIGVPAVGGRRFGADVSVAIRGTQASLRVEEAGRDSCDYAGELIVSGKLSSVGGPFTCASGEAGLFEIRELESTTHGLTGFITRKSRSGTAMTGRFSATRPAKPAVPIAAGP